MTSKKLLVLTLLQAVLLTVVKVYFFSNLGFKTSFYVDLYWAATAIITMALVRRFGVINFFEALFVCVIWLVVDMFVDLVFTSSWAGLKIFSQTSLWTGYLVMLAFIFFSHKMRHIHVRHELHALQHGHNHGHNHPSDHNHKKQH